MKKTHLLNEELLQLLEKHEITSAELARRLRIKPFMIYAIKSGRRTLGEELFVKILRKGFGYSEIEAKKIFLAAVERKYF